MGERTINGKSFEELKEALLKPFKPDDFKVNRYGYSYLPIEKFRQRMDEVAGIFNYDFDVTEPQITIVGTRPQIYLSGSITIKDDDGKTVTKKSSCGGVQVIMTNTENEPALLKNDLESATADVFKRCCKSFGIAEAQLKQLRSSQKTSDPKSNSTEPIVAYRIKLREAFSTVGKDGYGAMVDVVGEKEPRKLIIWKAAQEQIEKYISMPNFIKNYKANSEFRIYGYKDVFHKKNGNGLDQLQLIMEKPYVESEEGS